MKSAFRLALAVAILFPALSGVDAPEPALAQVDCGVVEAIDFPLPLDEFQVRYPFGRTSRRYNGMIHAGEDWTSRDGSSLGKPVYAVARGRVTLASPTVWGTDKGMVIVEHRMPDRTVWYSVYGHMEELNGHDFPRQGTCVERGDILGAIGAPRSSPHLHFEIRNFYPDRTGPGYWTVDPRTNGWANPTQFIINWQLWLRQLDRWRLPLFRKVASGSPAIMGQNGSIIYLDGNVLFNVSAGRQYIWYSSALSAEAVGLVRTGPQSLTVALANGMLEDWSEQGWRQRAWAAEGPITGTPIVFGDLLLVHAADAGLVAYGPDREPIWWLPEVARVADAAVSADVAALTDSAGAFWLIDQAGAVIERAALGQPGNVALAPDGGFYLRSQSGLWWVSPQGDRERLADAPRVIPGGSRLLSAPDGGFYLWTGHAAGEVIAYDAEGAVRWRQRVETDAGAPYIALDGVCRLAVANGAGYLHLFDAADGTPLNDLRVFTNPDGPAFVGFADDGLLRFLIYDHLIVFDVETLAGPCR